MEDNSVSAKLPGIMSECLSNFRGAYIRKWVGKKTELTKVESKDVTKMEVELWAKKSLVAVFASSFSVKILLLPPKIMFLSDRENDVVTEANLDRAPRILILPLLWLMC